MQGRQEGGRLHSSARKKVRAAGDRAGTVCLQAAPFATPRDSLRGGRSAAREARGIKKDGTLPKMTPGEGRDRANAGARHPRQILSLK